MSTATPTPGSRSCAVRARASRPAAASSSSTTLINDYDDPHAGHARGARPRLQRHQLLQADRVGDPRPGRGRRPGGGAPGRRLGGGAHRPDHRRPHPPRRGRRRPRRDLLAAAVRHGQGQVLPAHLRDPHAARRPSGSAWCRSASTTTEVQDQALEVATDWPTARSAASGSPSTRSTTGTGTMGPIFDASLASSSRLRRARRRRRPGVASREATAVVPQRHVVSVRRSPAATSVRNSVRGRRSCPIRARTTADTPTRPGTEAAPATDSVRDRRPAISKPAPASDSASAARRNAPTRPDRRAPASSPRRRSMT